MRELILGFDWQQIMLWGCAFFAALYLGFGALNLWLTRWLMPRLGHGGQLDPRPLGAGQLRRELGLSALSVLLFGTGSIFPWGLLQLGWAQLAVAPSALRIVAEIAVLVVWNEIHFYVNHWLLHSRWLRRFHLPHHRSIVVTPWSTYAFHPIEALMLGNVILLPMLVHDFAVWSLLAVPVFSIVFNNIGHSNYDFLPDFDRDRWWLNGARRHHLHHACYQGNYGFMFPFMDRLFGTALPPDAAKPQLDRHAAKQGTHAA
ncbi:sterol desaturase family protein [Chitinimonas taiwanensis]|uniref:Sterol desaturase/sphingolipid hydroxylase, fatty acid hydroxylase superfamily n=1 Tax=Chitinimonas taiwanensis DSM 18899 TaxID=1121279 RepID=A0A1K2H7U3_9NEIS|nr:sterol desaturase family protein [Chitinimonas taiwanensis]SFZ72163.1 Sterol desaturase/sphingolipid hydroxylase, fatty acid hydroxylase superfamily [Chitinimonas taiwanensis DSM 18899]